MTRIILLLALLTVVTSALDFTSDSSSCEDSHEHGGGHRPPGPRPPRPPGNGGQNGGCGAGWTRFTRPSGPWCIRVMRGETDRPAAKASCERTGGVLSGIQNAAERDWMTSEVLKRVNSGSIWIGAQRTEACRGQALTGSCTRTTSFRWTDGSTTGTSGFFWNSGQPDNAWKRIQNCVVLLASKSARVTARTLVWEASRLDDVQCTGLQSLLTNTPRKVFGYACGRKPRGN